MSTLDHAAHEQRTTPTTLRGVIFDMDGVLFDTMPLARNSFLAVHPGMTREMYNELHTGNVHDNAKKYTHLKIPETEAEKTERNIRYAAAKSNSDMFPGMRELVMKLHTAGIILAVNTNAFERNTLPLFEKSGITKYFSYIAAAEISKSKVEKFRLIQAKFSLSRDEMLFITDSLGDVREAEAAEIPTIAVTWGVHDESYFRREHYGTLKAIVNTVDQLRRRILP